MLKYILILSCGVITAQSVTNQLELRKISKSSHAEYEKSQVKVKNWIKNKNRKSKELNNLIGFHKKFPIFIETTDIDQRTTTNTDLLADGSLEGVSVEGEGILVYQWDSGRIRTAHQEFTDRAENLESEDSEYRNHSNMVASVIIAEGINPNCIGLAPRASLKAYNFYDNFSEMAEESANNPNYMISNHSYGFQSGWRLGDYGEGESWYWFGIPNQSEDESSLYGYYSNIDRDLDEIAYNAPNHLIIKAAGNDRLVGPDEVVDHYAWNENTEWYEVNGERPRNCMATGYDCISYGSVAKNIILVGSIDPIEPYERYESPEQFTFSSFSSRGPVDDGRIKPDVVSVGRGVFTATFQNDDSYFAGAYGTSFATPSVTGVATLLQQIYKEQEEDYLSAAALKALIINSTNELGEFDGPDYIHGWGLVDAFKAAKTEIEALNENAIIYEGSILDEVIEIPVSSNEYENISATLVWTDPVKDVLDIAFNNRTPHLVNDLDMRIVQNDSTYQPWTLNPDEPMEAAVKGDNVVDNVERIDIYNRTEGDYVIRISSKNTLENPQSFAVVASGLKYRGMNTVDRVTSNEILIYPNPVQNTLLISMPSNECSFLRILNENGQVIASKTIKSSFESISMESLSPGTYYIMFNTKDGIQTKKFIKK